ncbi:hypothetical protein CARUB_v10011243mg [Capsella rubella]|uniref:Dirigent protein n=1 Tax=Capsella rubella TaxID=81985 RepID=R0IK77_9BRAS|nr:hypothetical protein CARUB_v10011243mg [Capsella rubella]
MKISATTMTIAVCLLLLIAVQTTARPFTEETGEVPSSPSKDPPPPNPSANDNKNVMFIVHDNNYHHTIFP